MGARVAVAGASGYAGGELLRLIAGHPDLELGAITADSSAGRLVAEVHPNLAAVPALAGRRFDAAPAGRGFDCDLAFLALPAGQSGSLAARLPDSVKLVDLGPDYRLADAAAWARHYGREHAGHWLYGLPELPGTRDRIRAESRVAVPGCYATASILALAPLLAGGLVEPDDIVIAAASGTSGAGRALRQDLLGSEVMGSVAAYQAGGAHRHTPEIEQALTSATRPIAPEAAGPGPADQAGSALSAGQVVGPGPAGQAAGRRPAGEVSVSFTPMLAPMPRGILATCTARLATQAGDGGQPAGRAARTAPGSTGAAGGGRAGTAVLRRVLADAYAGEPFIWVLPEGHYPATAAVAGSNAVHLQAVADQRAGRATVLAAIDNLGKGAAGQAVQVANLMLGLPETAGLTAAGIAP
jgi:N-acetyl-gamma-glutamyl-phosphate reductase